MSDIIRHSDETAAASSSLLFLARMIYDVIHMRNMRLVSRGIKQTCKEFLFSGVFWFTGPSFWPDQCNSSS